MISHEHRCIFIHIPKCGGTSIERALGHHDGKEGRGTQDHRTIRHLQKPGLASLASLESARILAGRLIARPGENKRSRMTVTAAQFRDYFKFTVVRDPWSRAYSAYRNLVDDPNHRARWQIEPDLAFEPFLRRFVGRGMLRPQSYWIKNYSGRIELDYICRFERLEKEFRTACALAGIPAVPLPHLLPGRSHGWASHYTPGLVDLVAAAYREEIDYFGFNFERHERVETEPWRRVA